MSDFNFDDGADVPTVIDAATLAIILVQQLHDSYVALIEDLAAKGIVDADEYVVEEPIYFDTYGEAPPAA